MIIVVLCVVILCMRRSHRKRDKKVLYNISKPNTNIAINNNPSCNVIKVNTVDHEYSTIKPEGSYVSLLPPHDATTNQYDYPYFEDNVLILHPIVAANTSDSAKEVQMEIYATDHDDKKDDHSASSGEPAVYGVINQPKD